MSAGGSEGTADRPPADPSTEDEGPSQVGPSLPAVELPRKRKGDVEERQSLDLSLDEESIRSEGEDQQAKIQCFSLKAKFGCREPHSQTEKRRRDKMNKMINELATLIPTCQPMGRKLNKQTVLRKAVQYLKSLKAGSSAAFSDSCKPTILPYDDLRELLLKSADGFLLVVTCDRAKILFISKTVSGLLNYSWLELMGQSLFDFLHPKDINKVKEQMSSSEVSPHQRFLDSATGSQVQADAPVRKSHLSTGARRSFFCRMKQNQEALKPDDKHAPSSSSKKVMSDMFMPADTTRYCTLHCTGYLRSWHSSQLELPEGDTDEDAPHLTCLVTMCRLHPQQYYQPLEHVTVKPIEFVTRCAIDGKFTFVDQQATTVIGYLPQEILGTSCYEYFHQDDLLHLASKHRQVLRSKEKIETQCYKFKTKHGYYISLQSRWFSFTNPWTKEVEFIVSSNRVVSGPAHSVDEPQASCSKVLQEVAKQIPVIPSFSSNAGTMIYAGSIGTQIANEFLDVSRANSSPSSGASSPFGPPQDKGALVSPQTSQSASSREEAAGSSSQSKSESKSQMAAEASSGTSESTNDPSQLDLDSIVLEGPSSFSNNEAAIAVIMSLLETEANLAPGMAPMEDLEDFQWPF
ncbi:basic helix-loop-helix ARNT-like protein 1 [Pholidichthys leucotaenia]